MSVNKLEKAKLVYDTLCSILDDVKATYRKVEDTDELKRVALTFTGEDFPMDILFTVDTERQLVELVSFLTFKMVEDKILDGAVAVCASNFGLLEGNFIYDVTDGAIGFKNTFSYRDSDISKTLLECMLYYSCKVIDKYNDKFFALNKGYIEVSEFFIENK